jgi:hypothetical protein
VNTPPDSGPIPARFSRHCAGLAAVSVTAAFS